MSRDVQKLFCFAYFFNFQGKASALIFFVPNFHFMLMTLSGFESADKMFSE